MCEMERIFIGREKERNESEICNLENLDLCLEKSYSSKKKRF